MGVSCENALCSPELDSLSPELLLPCPEEELPENPQQVLLGGSRGGDRRPGLWGQRRAPWLGGSRLGRHRESGGNLAVVLPPQQGSLGAFWSHLLPSLALAWCELCHPLCASGNWRGRAGCHPSLQTGDSAQSGRRATCPRAGPECRGAGGRGAREGQQRGQEAVVGSARLSCRPWTLRARVRGLLGLGPTGGQCPGGLCSAQSDGNWLQSVLGQQEAAGELGSAVPYLGRVELVNGLLGLAASVPCRHRSAMARARCAQLT